MSVPGPWAPSHQTARYTLGGYGYLRIGRRYFTAVSGNDREWAIDMETKTYTVTGMTCGHCVNSVGSEITQIPGVTDVQVDLVSGAVTVISGGARSGGRRSQIPRRCVVSRCPVGSKS